MLIIGCFFDAFFSKALRLDLERGEILVGWRNLGLVGLVGRKRNRRTWKLHGNYHSNFMYIKLLNPVSCLPGMMVNGLVQKTSSLNYPGLG